MIHRTPTINKSFKDKPSALAFIGKEVSSTEPGGALYPAGALRWRFIDGSMAVCHRWDDKFIVSWIFNKALGI